MISVLLPRMQQTNTPNQRQLNLPGGAGRRQATQPQMQQFYQDDSLRMPEIAPPDEQSITTLMVKF